VNDGRSTRPESATANGERRSIGLAELLREAEGLPDRSAFPTVDELVASFHRMAEASGGRMTGRRVGTSRLGEPIHCFSIGTGTRNHLIVGGPHPNEPIGSLTIQALAELVLDRGHVLEDLDATWHIVPCIDPDGMRLNEGWFDRPTDRLWFATHFYRPAPNEQSEWTFPFAYKGAYFDQVLPETAAFMRLIDELEPVLLVSLHNSELGGVYFYISHEIPGLPQALQAVAGHLGLPLHTGEPEVAQVPEFATAVFGEIDMRAMYDYLESVGEDPSDHIGGTSSADYAHRHGTFSVVAEAPQWTHPDADDDTEIEASYASVLSEMVNGLKDLTTVLADALAEAERHLSLDTPYLRGSRAFIPSLSHGADVDAVRAADPSAQRPATVAERFSCQDLVRCFRLRFGGMLLHAMDAELVAGTANAPLRRCAERLRAVYRAWCEEAATVAAQPIPLNRVAGLQLGTILVSAAAVAGRLDADGVSDHSSDIPERYSA
jgi:hypothetical protein